MSARPFDFASYLEHVTGVTNWHIEVLLGGAANFTVRVFRNPCANALINENQELLHIIQDSLTVIIKQAPPFLAKAPHMPFSPYRQVCRCD